LTIVLYVLLLSFFWPLYCMSFFCSSFDHCIVYPSSIYGFDLFCTVKFFIKRYCLRWRNSSSWVKTLMLSYCMYLLYQ
jgi:hypothetical protein